MFLPFIGRYEPPFIVEVFSIDQTNSARSVTTMRQHACHCAARNRRTPSCGKLCEKLCRATWTQQGVNASGDDSRRNITLAVASSVHGGTHDSASKTYSHDDMASCLCEDRFAIGSRRCGFAASRAVRSCARPADWRSHDAVPRWCIPLRTRASACLENWQGGSNPSGV